MDIALPTSSSEGAFDDERQLVERARRDPASLSRLYRDNYAAIRGYVLRRVRDEDVADDLTAEVFLSMVRSLCRFRWQGAPFRAWLFRIATNEVNGWATKRRRMTTCQLEAALAASTPMDWQGRLDDQELVHLALLSLPSRMQEALTLHYLEQMPVADVAVVLGCTTGTVKSRLSRGRDLLKKSLTSRG